MKYIQYDRNLGNVKAPSILLVCCVHGDEVAGAEFYKYFFKHRLNNVSLLFANEEAFANNVRYIDTDLNRSFDLNRKSKEVDIANEIKKIIKNYDIVIDIHTTTSNLEMVPIVKTLNQNTIQITQMLQINEVVSIPFLSKNSLISQCSFDKVGISLEYGEYYLENKKTLKNEIKKLHRILESISKNGIDYYCRHEQTYYEIFGESDKFNLKNIQNFEEVVNMVIPPTSNTFNVSCSLYAFLVGEKSYKNKIFLLRKLQ